MKEIKQEYVNLIDESLKNKLTLEEFKSKLKKIERDYRTNKYLKKSEGFEECYKNGDMYDDFVYELNKLPELYQGLLEEFNIEKEEPVKEYAKPEVFKPEMFIKQEEEEKIEEIEKPVETHEDVGLLESMTNNEDAPEEIVEEKVEEKIEEKKVKKPNKKVSEHEKYAKFNIKALEWKTKIDSIYLKDVTKYSKELEKFNNKYKDYYFVSGEMRAEKQSLLRRYSPSIYDLTLDEYNKRLDNYLDYVKRTFDKEYNKSYFNEDVFLNKYFIEENFDISQWKGN